MTEQMKADLREAIGALHEKIDRTRKLVTVSVYGQTKTHRSRKDARLSAVASRLETHLREGAKE